MPRMQDRTGIRFVHAMDTEAAFPDHLSGAGPAAAYRDKNGTHDQLVVVHRGWGKRAAGSEKIRVPRRCPGIPRKKPDSVTADKG
ncbi:hypothetical protein ACFTZI_01025 [Streptomyces decoyicus]|uniref:hypothetical protein n=1 Tax=Streptomyces decoyicus TaxID=249567 RepID=UPI0036409287